MSKFAFMFPGGKFIDNQEELGAVSTKTWTVPANKRWWIFMISLERDANATLQIELNDASDKWLGWIMAAIGAGTSEITCGVGATGYQMGAPLPVDAGYKIKATWGAAQTSPLVALVALEVDV